MVSADGALFKTQGAQAHMLLNVGKATGLVDDFIELGAVFEQVMQLLEGAGQLVLGDELANLGEVRVQGHGLGLLILQ